MITCAPVIGHPSTSATSASAWAMAEHVALLVRRRGTKGTGFRESLAKESLRGSLTIDATGWRSPELRRLLPPWGRCLPR